jgi:peptidoglycan/LPS O-acetylase OafA/YrhL
VAFPRTTDPPVVAPSPRPALPYLPGIDGLRAVAVLAVIAYHLGWAWVPGGFLGVEIFFVVSGYLITSLLVAEHRRHGTVSLRGFWMRRARRLFPGLYLTLAATVVAALVLAPDALPRLRGDVPAAVGYVSNWWQILHQDSYFEQAGRPPLLAHLWSLAVEEQFYLIVPIVALVVLPRFRRSALALGALVIGGASALLMAVRFDPEVDPSRLYLGTDTRLSGLLAGVALGLWWTPTRIRADRAGRHAGVVLDTVGLVSATVLLWALLRVNEFDPFVYRGGFVVVDVATVGLIIALVHPASRCGRWLGTRVLREIGFRSYLLYLWHWPLFQLTRPGLDLDLAGPAVLALRVVLLVALTEVSYRLVERPIRRGALRRRWEATPTLRARDVRWALGAAVLVAGLVVTGPVIRPDSTATSLQSELAGASEGFDPATLVAPSTTAVPTTTSAVSTLPPDTAPAVPSTGPAAPTDTAPPVPAETVPPVTEPPPPVTTTTFPPGMVAVTAIGDSVMLGARRDLQASIPQIAVDATVSRQFHEADEEAVKLAAFGALGPTVVLHLGTNGPMTPGQIDHLMRVLGNRRVLFLTIKVPRPWEGIVNQRVLDAAKRWPNITVVDWIAFSAPHPEWFEKDGTHLNEIGRIAYAQFVRDHL